MIDIFKRSIYHMPTWH